VNISFIRAEVERDKFKRGTVCARYLREV